MTDEAVEVLQNLTPVSPNDLTDAFGIYRHWGPRTWHPHAGYSPIHAGIDYSAQGDEHIYAPCDAYAYGQMPGGPVGSALYLRPVVAGEALDNVMITMFHCEPGPPQWREVAAGDVLTTHASHGIGAAHLHYEIDVTYDLYRKLVDVGLIRPRTVSEHTIRGRAARRKLDPGAVVEAVNAQRARWGIERLEHDAIVRTALPEYRQSQYSRVGRETTVVINPRRFVL